MAQAQHVAVDQPPSVHELELALDVGHEADEDEAAVDAVVGRSGARRGP